MGEELLDILHQPELGVVALDLALREVGHPLDRHLIDDGGEQSLARAVPMANGHPHQLAA